MYANPTVHRIVLINLDHNTRQEDWDLEQTLNADTLYCRDCSKHHMHKEQKGSSRSEAFNMLNDTMETLIARQYKKVVASTIQNMEENKVQLLT